MADSSFWDDLGRLFREKVLGKLPDDGKTYEEVVEENRLLRERVELLESSLVETRSAARRALTKARDEVEDARKALKFYAEKKNWKPYYSNPTKATRDEGKRARKFGKDHGW